MLWLLSLIGILNDSVKERNQFTVAGNHDWKKTDGINSAQSSFPFWGDPYVRNLKGHKTLKSLKKISIFNPLKFELCLMLLGHETSVLIIA